MICYLYEAPIFFKAPVYLFYTADLPSLLYYSHIPTTLIALAVGLFVFLNARHRLLNRLLLIITLCFSTWTILSLLAWTNINADFLAFIWPFFAIFASLLSIFSIYFVYVFLNNGEDISNKLKLVFLALLTPVFLLAHTNLSVSGFNLINCGAFEFEGLAYKIYYNLLGFLAMGWIFILILKKIKTSTPGFRKQIILMGIGIEFFLFSFITTIFIVTTIFGLKFFENTIFNLQDTSPELYGLFGMTIFMTMMGVLIVRFKTFSVGMLASNALMIVLLILVGSQYTYVDTTTGVVLTSVTLLLTAIVGWMVIRNVKKEIAQREQIEKLAVDLEKANVRLKELDKMKSEFVSIASHQLRSPITSIRGYISMLLEGSYGNFPDKARDILQNISDSSKYMASSIEDYLNVSRIEAGNMKYELSDFSLKEQAEKVTDELRQVAMKKGLVLVFRSDCTGTGVIHADIGKVRQVMMNLIDNSIKYTPKGTITVVAHDDTEKKKMFVTIQDTGIGMNKETLEEVFDKFVRAKNANEVNVTGTGLGLFVAKKMVTQMKGKVWAESEGEEKGSTFHIEFPLIPGKANPNK